MASLAELFGFGAPAPPPPPPVKLVKKDPFDIPPVPDPLDVTFGDALSEGATSYAQDFGAAPETANKIGNVLASALQLHPAVALTGALSDVNTSKNPESIWTASQAAMDAVNPFRKIETILNAGNNQTFTPSPTADVLASAAAPPEPPPPIGHNQPPGEALPVERAAPVPAAPRVADDLAAATAPAEPTLWHPVSTIKLQKPLEEMRKSLQPKGLMLDKKLILPEDFKIGDRLLMFPGDRTAAGKQLTGFGDLEFKTPVDLVGGGEYQRGPHQIANKTAWASHGGMMKGHAKRAREGSAKGGDVHGGYVPMAHPASDFSQQTTNAVKQAIQAKLDHGEITQAQVDAFDERVRGTRGKEGSTDFIGPSPEWPGILNATQEQIESHGPTRLKVAKFADSKEYGHLVDMGELRNAINATDLRDTQPYDFGFSFAKMDPEGRFAENPALRHPDYNTQGLGEYEGGWDFNAPLDVTMRDWAKATAERKGMPLSAMNPARLQRSAYMQNPTQTIDQEWIDTLMMLRQEQLRKGDR